MKRPQRRLRITGLALLVLVPLLIVFHQVRYVSSVGLASSLQDSLRFLNQCPDQSLEARRVKDPEPAPQPGPGKAFFTIPDVLHQIWKTADYHTYAPDASPDEWKVALKPFNYTVRLWTDDDVMDLISREYPWLLSTYKGYSQNIQRADVARLAVVHAEGGIYADLDVYPTSVELVRCLQHLGLQAVFPSTGDALGLSNQFFMAEKGSPFLYWALQEAKRRGGSASKSIILPYLQVFWSTGPMMVTAALRKYAWMFPTAGHRVGLMELGLMDAVINHQAGRSWHSADGRLLNWFGDMDSKSLPEGLLLLPLLFGVVFFVLRRYRRRKLSTGSIAIEL